MNAGTVRGSLGQQPYQSRILMLNANRIHAGAEDTMLAFLRMLPLLVLGFRYRLPLLPDQSGQNFSQWKLVSDGLDNVS